MNNHLTPQKMLAYIDGELSRTETRRAKRHLQACWTCLAEIERLKGDIATILDAQNEAFSPALPPAPLPWPGFDTVLARSNVRTPRSSFFERMSASWNDFFSPVRIAVVSAMIAAMVICAYSIRHVGTVSAKEVLRKIQIADERRSVITKDQVIRQRVRIRKTTHNQKPKLANIDTWKSPTATYWSIENNDSAASDLQTKYKAHNIPVDLPLSVMAIDAWGKTVGGNPTVSRHGDDVGLSFAQSEKASGSVERISLLIQPQDWHIKQMTLDFPDASFEVAEDDYAVIPASEVPSNLIAYLEPESLPALGRPSRPISDMAASSIHLPTNLDKAELDVFATLHRLKADLGEPVTVTRSKQMVRVGLWQLPPDRQNELRAALSDREGVQLELANSNAAPKKKPAVPEAVSPQTVETPLQVPPEPGEEDPRLVKYFGSLQKQQDFTNEALGTSTSILSHLYALKNLQMQFPAENRQPLAPEEQQQLDSLVRDHVTAVSAYLETLSRQLAPLDTNFGVPTCVPMTSPMIPTWQHESVASLATARTVDHLLRTLLTTSQTPSAPDSALPQINQNLCNLRSQLKSFDSQIH